MKVCIAAPDSKIANLAILKIAAYHLTKGDEVKWYEPLFDEDAELLYISKVFTFTPDFVYAPDCEVIKGGTGYDVKSVLPPQIEAITDISSAYSVLYPEIDYSIVFTSRGCVRHCPFCLVPSKEGIIHDDNIVSLNPNGQYVKILDNNFFSSPTWRSRLEVVKAFNQPLDFNQGIDIRAITDEQCAELGRVNIKRSIHFAWDSLNDENAVMKGIERITKHIKPSNLTCYCLVGFENTEITDGDHYRIEKLHSLGITPFAMGFINYDGKNERSRSVIDFCRWVNAHIFKTVPFDEYDSSIKRNIQYESVRRAEVMK